MYSTKKVESFSPIQLSGKVPPQAPEIEEAVIGECLIDSDAATMVASFLKPEMFYSPQNQHIYQSIYDLTIAGKAVDILTVMQDLRAKNEIEEVGGPTRLVELSSAVVTTLNIEQHAQILKQKFTLREFLRFSYELQNKIDSDEFSDVCQFAEDRIYDISFQSETKEPKRVDNIVNDVLSNVSKIINNPSQLLGVPSGFSKVDRITGGFQAGNLILIAARPRIGKSACALSIAASASILGHPTAFFSLEMSEAELVTRLLSGESDFTNIEIRAGRVDFKKLVDSSERVAVLPMYIDDTPMLSVVDLRRKAKKLKAKNRIELIIIDYIQLMQGDANAGNREQEVSSISRGLKRIAKELSIPIIALAQLNRAVEARSSRRPALSDLRESGSLEQNSDVVALLSRPAEDGIMSVELNGDEINTKGLMIFDIAKNRHGASYAVPLFHNQALTKISDNPDDINKVPF